MKKEEDAFTLSRLKGQRDEMCELFLFQVPQYAGR